MSGLTSVPLLHLNQHASSSFDNFVVIPLLFFRKKKKKKGTICLGKQRKKVNWSIVEEVKIPTFNFTFCFNSYLYHYFLMSFVNYIPHVLKFLDYFNGKTVSVGTFGPARHNSHFWIK